LGFYNSKRGLCSSFKYLLTRRTGNQEESQPDPRSCLKNTYCTGSGNTKKPIVSTFKKEDIKRQTHRENFNGTNREYSQETEKRQRKKRKIDSVSSRKEYRYRYI
jgi:hypothetical protein